MKNNSSIFPIVGLFILLTILVLLFRSALEKMGFDLIFLLVSNALLFLLSLAGFSIQAKAIHSENPQKFVRGVYASMIVKMFVCMIAVLIYMVMNKEKINKPALFASMVIYIFYTVIEVSVLMKAARKNKNA
ncbi:MAG: hypothetical protein ABJA57_01775 [Ginsengibacter sp.]